MTRLIHMIQTITDDDRAIRLADRIHAKVTGLRVAKNGGGIEILLTLTGEIPDGRDLIELENMLRSSLKVTHVRFFLSGDFHTYSDTSFLLPLLPWMLSALRRENPMYSPLITYTRFTHAPTCVIGKLADSFDPDLERLFAESFAGFVQKYLNIRCDFTFERDKKENAVSLSSLAREHDERLRREAATVLSQVDQEQGDTGNDNIHTGSSAVRGGTKPAAGRSGNERKPGEKANQTTSPQRSESLNAPPPPPEPVSTDSWAFRAKAVAKENKTTFTRQPKAEGILWGKVNPTTPFVKISEMNANTGTARFDGFVEIAEFNLTKSGSKVRVNFYVTDDSGCVACVYFMAPEDADAFEARFKKGGYARFQANVYFDDRYSKDLQASVEGVMEALAPPKRMDNAPVKRVELHCHTKMSEKDAVMEVSHLLAEACRFGHPACAITDHGVVQSFPDAAVMYKKLNEKRSGDPFKVIYGMEGYLVDDGPCVAYHADEETDFSEGFVAVDVETTGLDSSADSLIEIGAVRFIRNSDDRFVVGETFHTFVSPGKPIPATTVELTGITDTDVADAPAPYDAVSLLSDFIGTRPVCGHNVLFDLAFLRQAGFDIDIEKHERYRVKFNPVAIDTLAIARHMYPQIAEKKLSSVATFFGVTIDRAHRAVSDAMACGEILSSVLHEHQIFRPAELNEKAGMIDKTVVVSRKQKVYHIIFLAQNALGLYHLYRLVSESHTEYFHMRPRIPRSELQYFSAGIIIGSACERGEVFSHVMKVYRDAQKDMEAAKAALLSDRETILTFRMYDYLEIQPITNNRFFLRDPDSGLTSDEDLMNLNRLIIALGERMRLPVCATTDAHFFEKSEGEYRKYILMDMEYKDAEFQSDLYFRTTEEMLLEFRYLGESTAYEVVVENTRKISDRIVAGIKPFPDGTYPPIIETAPDDIRNLTWDAAREIYGYQGEICETVKARVEKELDSIIGNGFAIMYYIAYRLVKKSNEDGYIVGSRGSVGSSLVATFCGISEVNPLPPHHVCPSCRFSIFEESGEIHSGYDLPRRDCPQCGTTMRSDGQDIPFETFLGFFGDKQPDIDLNFSNEYQSRAHKYVAELFGESHTFRAGTIGCYADKNAIAVINKLQAACAIPASRAELRRKSLGLIGVKRTTGQHPGGIVVVPKEMDVYEFTPIQHPANKLTCGTTTTHFDFNAMHDTILKLDILGHYDPTMLRMLSDLTGVDVRQIPIPDPKVMSLFVTTEALGFPPEATDSKCGTLGLSEMGTFMARGMIAETRPSSFYDLVQLMGLSHGTDVWKGNAQDLIQNKTCTLNTVIGCRDGIMTQLISWGLPNKASFDIMEKVRKGKGLSAEHEALMREKNVPDWYIDSCKKIKYMFPKAHAAAYSISSLRIAWFKVYYPEEYYCSFFTVRAAEEFNGDYLCAGIDTVKARRLELYDNFNNRKPNEKSEYYLCELVEEMHARGIDFLPYSIEESDAIRFKKVAKGKILPPLAAIPTISQAMAESIARAREEGLFKTRDELLRRSGIGPTALAKIVSTGCLNHLPESSQIDLFSLM